MKSVKEIIKLLKSIDESLKHISLAYRSGYCRDGEYGYIETNQKR
jgi:hypothetical protein